MSDGRPVCKYGASCYRRNPEHIAAFFHPPAPDLPAAAPAPAPRAPSPEPAVRPRPEDDRGQQQQQQHQGPSELSGKTVCFSGGMCGMTRVLCRARAQELGARVVDGVSSKVDILFVGADPGGKLDKARDLGVQVMGEDDWARISSGADAGDSSPQSKRQRVSAGDPPPAAVSGWRAATLAAPAPAPAPAAPAPPAAAQEKRPDARPRCKYGRQCYRRGNPAHTAEYSHSDAEDSEPLAAPTRKASPGGPHEAGPLQHLDQLEDAVARDPGATIVCAAAPAAPVAVAAAEDPPQAAEQAVLEPLHRMEPGETADVPSGTSSATYQVKRVGDHYYCTCVAWKQQSAPINRRTCKHLRSWLGDAFEDRRVGTAADVAAARREAAERRQAAPGLLLAHRWDEDAVDPAGWWVSEKLDGVRAYWDGKDSLVSRAGNPFPAPGYFVSSLPQGMPLDGELWSGRGTFQTVVSIVRSEGSPGWRSVFYHVFDAPAVAKPFEGRLDDITAWFASHPAPHVRIVPHARCEGREHLFRELRAVEQGGGEGLMLRKPGSNYAAGRSATLLKVKTFLDAEARVVGYEPGKGKFVGMTGALQCVMACGKKFKVGSGMSDRDRASPPAVGSIISYRFQELTEDGVPRFPAFVRLRPDVTEPADALPKKRAPNREED
eukprot:m51a1_g6701 putative dna ligase (662) ;mRNA; f:96109-98276